MPRDLFEERGITVPKRKPRDLFIERGIKPPSRQLQEQRLNEDSLLADISRAATHIPGVSRLAKAVEPITDPTSEFFEQYVQPVAAGGLQGLGNSAISIGNLIPGINVPHLNLREKFKDTAGEKLFGSVPEFIGGLGGGVGAYKALGKGLEKAAPYLANAGEAIMHPTNGFLRYLGNITKGFGSGYATGENEKHEGRALGGAIGAALPAVSPLVPFAASSSAAKRIIKDSEKLESTFNKHYGNIFKKAKSSGIKKVELPSFNKEKVFKHATNDETEALKKFFEKPTLENAHKAQSDLGFALRRMKDIEKKSGFTSTKKEGYNAIKEARDKIKGSITSKLGEAESSLGKEYTKLTKRYLDEMVPFKNRAISKYKEGGLTDVDLISSLSRNKEFKKKLGKRYPGVSNRDLLKRLAYTGAVVGGLKYAPRSAFDRILGRD